MSLRPIDRRTFLTSAAGLAAAMVPATAALPADSTQAKARRNLKLGIDANAFGHLTVEDAARRIRSHGFRSVFTNYCFADARFDPLKPNWDAADKVVKAFDRQGIRIAAVFGYTNVVDPDPVKRKRAEERLTVLLTNWKRLGCSNISTETGTLNAQSEWADSPENYTEAGYLQCRTAMERLARTAEKAQAVLSIEPYWRNVIDGIDRAARLFHDVQSPLLRLVMDPCNYYRKADLCAWTPCWKRCSAAWATGS